MIWQYKGNSIPLERYHGVPKGWYADQIRAEHKRLGGRFDLQGPEATEPGAPSWMPERYQWLQYREILYRISDGVRAQDFACVELAVRYIELHYIGSYSGFIRARLARALKHADLTEGQRYRLHNHFRILFMRREFTQEFRQYFRLWRQIIQRGELEGLTQQIHKQSNGEERVEYLRKKLLLSG